MKANLCGVFASAALFAVTFAPTQARAEYVPASTSQLGGIPQSALQGAGNSSLNTTQLVYGSSLSINALTATGAGTLTVKLEDLGWPDALQSLDLLITDLDTIWERDEGRNSFSLFVSGPTQLFAAVHAQSVDGGYGLYNLHASFAPVPLPAAVWLLLSGLGGLGLLRRRRS